MKSSIELLESRRLFTAATVDYSALISDEQGLPSVFGTANRQESLIRGAVHADLNRLGLYRANDATLAALARNEAAAITKMRRDVLLIEEAANHDARTLIVRGAAGQQFSTNPAFRNAFSAALAKFEQDEVKYQQMLFNDSSNASSGTAVSELAALGAADPSDATLQSDADSGVTNLQLLSTTLTNEIDIFDGTSATIVSDSSGIAVYGSENFFGQGYATNANPYQGATLSGLAANVSSVAISKYVAPATFAPAVGDYAGTDQIYVGSDQLPGPDQLAGPQVITLDYSALTKLSRPIKSFTLGIATDGFENPTINIPYTVSINGVVNTQLTSILNNLNDADRVEQYVSIGIDPAQLLASKVLTISIDSPGNDVSGWAVDFLTVGIQNG